MTRLSLLLESIALAVILQTATPVYAQLHLIAGTPTPKSAESFAVDLFEVQTDGTLQLKSRLASEEEGLWWIQRAEDEHVIALMTRHTKDAVVVLDTRQAKVIKRCDSWPDVPGYVSHEIWPTEQWLTSDGTGNLFVGRYGSRGDPDAVLQGMSLDPSLPCASSFKMLAPTDVSSLYVQGNGGLPQFSAVESIIMTVDAAGQVRTRIGGSAVYLGYTVPRDLWGDLKVPLFAVLANTPKLLVVYNSDRENPQKIQTVVYDKTARVWSRLPLPDLSNIRAFGSSVTMTERVPPSPDPAQRGGKSRRTRATVNGPDKAFWFGDEEERGRSYPGRLHVYNVATQKRTLIVTNEEDSEVLLVDGDSVYYRVNNSIYKCDAGSSGLLPGTKLATDERIGDVHWAFVQ